MATRGCVISPNSFCYICGEFTIKSQQRNISDFVRKVYFAYFKLKLGDQDKPWASHKVCRRCEDHRLWFKVKKNAFRFGIPMIWREQKNHTTDCYFCSIDVKGFNSKNKRNISYPNLDSVIRPVPHSSEISIPQPPFSLDQYPSELEDEATLPPPGESNSDLSFDKDGGPQLFSQGELNDLVGDLGLSKDAAELLGSRLKNKNLLSPGTSFYWYRHPEKEFTQFFSKEGNLVFCNNVEELIHRFDIKYDSSEWRLFIDSSKTSLKAVLLHNGNKFASIPIGHSVHMKEDYKDLAIILEKIKYEDHQWMICGDFKILTMLLGQQAGYTKYPCFLCLWDSRTREQHWKKVIGHPEKL